MAGRPLRAAFFLPDLDAGGAQRTIINLIGALPSDRVTPTLIVGRGDGAARAWLDGTESVIDLGCPRLRQAVLPLRQVLKRDRPDVLLATVADANVVAALAAHTVSPRPGLILRETNSHRARGDLSRLRRKAIGLAYRSADRIVALSSGVAAELIADYRLDQAKVTTIHNPIDIDAWAASARAARQQAAPWSGVMGDGPVLIGAGRLVRQKGFDLLLRALATSTGEGARANLVLIGEGPERAALTQLASELGIGSNVLMPGYVTEPAIWYAHADLFVLSSRWEGFGHVIVEAIASGLPVIAFDCPYGPADILAGEARGILVPPGDVGALARAIDDLLGTPARREELASIGLRAADRFKPQRIAQRYTALIEEVAAEHGNLAAHS